MKRLKIKKPEFKWIKPGKGKEIRQEHKLAAAGGILVVALVCHGFREPVQTPGWHVVENATEAFFQEIETAKAGDRAGEPTRKAATVTSGEWVKKEKGWSYLQHGQELTSVWAVINGDTYYFDEDGLRVENGMRQIGENAYFFDSAGLLVRSQLIDDTYLTDGNGMVLTGYQWIGTAQYYFKEDGAMQKGGNTPDGMYHLNSEGQIVSIIVSGSKTSCPLRNAPGTSGYEISGIPVELFMLSIAGETSGGSIISGDGGKAYGLCQFDYRYDLMDFINYAYGIHPNLWIGFQNIAGKYGSGDGSLVGNTAIEEAFRLADSLSAGSCAGDQLSFLYRRYFQSTYNQLEAAGFNLRGRHIAVSAAIMSININCGPKTSLYLSNLSADMTDDQLLDKLYELRNGVMSGNGKGTNTRYQESELQLAKAMVAGEVKANSSVSLPGGVSWNKSMLKYCGEELSEAQIARRLASLGPGVLGELGLTLNGVASASDAPSTGTVPMPSSVLNVPLIGQTTSPRLQNGSTASESASETTQSTTQSTAQSAAQSISQPTAEAAAAPEITSEAPSTQAPLSAFTFQ